MLDLIKLRNRHGYQSIRDIPNAKLPEKHRGFPVIDETKCTYNCQICDDICPVSAIALKPLSIDIGKCTFCGECERVCESGAVKFTPDYKSGSTDREKLIIKSNKSFDDFRKDSIICSKEIHKIFGRSLKFRQVSAAGCNGCEMELAACSNVNFDMGRFGIDFVASPRHADGVVITGPVSKNMAPALMDAYNSISDPKIVVAAGACAISSGIFSESDELNRKFFEEIKIDLYIPGCPPHPLNFINSVLDFIRKK